MRGMKSLVAPTKRQNFADGGVVGAIKGMFGIKPEDPERARRLAEYKANAEREKQAAKAAAAAPAPAPAPAITDYAAGSALKRREAAAGLKDGGPVRGPGTGTSDDVPDNVPEGTYIMPADSTQAIGEKTLGGLGMRGIDVNLSNGEFKLPPKQVHAIGVQALNQMKDATHTPSSTEAAKGMKPELFFEGGGVVDEEKKRLQNQTQAYVTGAQAAAAAVPPARAAGPSELYMADRTQEMGDQWRAGNYAGAVGTGLRTAVQGLGMYGIETADKALSPVIDASQRMVGGVLGTDTPSGAVKPSIAPPVTPPAPGSAAAKSAPVGTPPSAPAASASTATLPDTGGSLPTPQPLGTSTAIAPGVYQHGRGQYSDNASGMGMPAGFTGQPSAENMARMDAIANRSQQESMNRVQARGMGAVGGPGSGPVEPGSFTGGFSGVIGSANLMGSRTPEQQRRDAEVSASSIHKPTAARGMAALAAMDGRALEQERGQNSLAQENARQAGALEREGIQQAGATTRANIQERGANSREAGRNTLATEELGLKREAAGFQTRAAGRLEKLYERYDAAKTQDERKAIAQQIRELHSGSVQQDVWAHSPGGQVVDPKTQMLVTQPGVIYNRATGETRSDAGRIAPAAATQGGGPATPKSAAEYDALPSGAQYIKNGITYTKG